MNLAINRCSFRKDRRPIDVPISENRARITGDCKQHWRPINARQLDHVVELKPALAGTDEPHDGPCRYAKPGLSVGLRRVVVFVFFSGHGELAPTSWRKSLKSAKIRQRR